MKGLPIGVFSTIALAMCSTGLATFATAGDIAPQTLEHIKSIEAAKLALPPSEAKISSALLGAINAQLGRPVSSVPTVRPMMSAPQVSKTPIELDGDITASLKSAIISAGGRITGESQDGHKLTCLLASEKILEIARRPDVRSVKQIPMEEPRQTSSIDSGGLLAHDVIGADDSYGAKQGAGVKVCVVSNGVDSLTARPALNAVVDKPGGFVGSGDEGTAMLELVHAVAPKAPLGFGTSHDASGFGTAISMASHIRALASSGCKIIVDDIGLRNESPFESGEVGRAIREVTDEGRLFFSAAGNDGSKNRGSSSTWEGDFIPRGDSFEISPTAGSRNTQKLYGTTTTFNARSDAFAHLPNNLNKLISLGGTVVSMFWSDPMAASKDQYHLFAVNDAGDVVYQSTDDAQPQQIFIDKNYDFSKGLALIVLRISKDQNPDMRFVHIGADGSRLETSTNGAVYGHAASGAENEMTIAEVDVPATANDSFSEAPDTLPRDASSDGPRLRFYAHDGSAFTPYDLSSRYGGKTFYKPDFAAASCVQTDVPKFETFCGTSAAAPHAAGIAALVWSNFPGLSASDVHRVLLLSAIPPTAASGVSPINQGRVAGGGENAWSETLGFGIVMADRALAAANMLPYADFLKAFFPNKSMVDLMLSTTSFASGTRDDPTRSFGMTILTKDKQILLFYRYNMNTFVRGMTPDRLGNGPPVITDPVSITMNGFETTVRNSDGTEAKFNGLDVYNQFLHGGTQ